LVDEHGRRWRDRQTYSAFTLDVDWKSGYLHRDRRRYLGGRLRQDRYDFRRRNGDALDLAAVDRVRIGNDREAADDPHQGTPIERRLEHVEVESGFEVPVEFVATAAANENVARLGPLETFWPTV
jgi:hypothetical protein